MALASSPTEILVVGSVSPEFAGGSSTDQRPCALNSRSEAPNSMPSRRSWPGLHSQGRRRCEELLRFELAATPQMRIVQLCVVDHSGDAYRANAHIHVQCLLSDRTRSQWVQLNATLADLRAAAHAVLSGHVRLHLHDPQSQQRKPEAADAEVAAALPTATLTERALGALTARSELRGCGAPSCAICLGDFAAGESLLALPCGHTAHDACLKQWLETARTCPTCRFSLPAKDDAALRPALDRARSALAELDDNVLDAALGENVLMPDAPPPSPPMGKAELAEVPPPPPPPLVEAAAEPPPTPRRRSRSLLRLHKFVSRAAS